MTKGPSINVDEFRHRPVRDCSDLPNKGAVKAAIKDLETANVDISTIRVCMAKRVFRFLRVQQPACSARRR
jgi:hypothetical protein